MTVDDSMEGPKRKAGAAEAANSHSHGYPPRCVGAPCSDVVQRLKAVGGRGAVGALVAG